MNRVDIDQVLQQMRAVKVQTSMRESVEAPRAAEVGFGDMLKQSINQVNDLQHQSQKLANDFERGDDVSLAELMIAKNKSSLAFSLTMEVRNKMVDAYKEIMNMHM